MMKKWPGSEVECIWVVADGVEVPTFKCFEAIFANILTVVVSLAVIALFVMLLVGGFKFLTSRGDPKATTAAQQTMTYAVLGIALMVVAYLIFQLIYYFTGVDVTTFTIPTDTVPAP